MKIYRTILAISLVAAFAACGGGGGDTPVAPVVPPVTVSEYPLSTAYANFVTTAGTSAYTVTGSYVDTNGTLPVTGSGTVTWGALVPATFEGIPAQMSTRTMIGTVSVAGASAPVNSTAYDYFDSNYRPLGSRGSYYTVVQSSNPFPATARVNDNGIWYTAYVYDTSAKTNVLGAIAEGWLVEPDTATTALLTFVGVAKNLSGTTTEKTTSTYRMTAAGALTRVSETGVAYTSTATITLNIKY